MAAYVRPGNCESLTLTRVNPEIWEKLSLATRSSDIKLQRVQNANVQAMVAITHTTDALVAATKSEENFSKTKMASTITALVDGLALMANAAQELNQRRRDGQRPDLNAAYKGLCNNDTGMTRLLYGDDLTAKIKEINEPIGSGVSLRRARRSDSATRRRIATASDNSRTRRGAGQPGWGVLAELF